MVLFKEGGIYSDARTIPIKPLNDWIKQSWLCNDVNFIAGVESLENDFQLCEWTIASVPNHEILNTTITQIFDIIQKSNLEEKEFMETIGFAGRFSSVIFKTWENLGYTLDDFKEFGSDPKCLSKKLILPSAFFNPGMIYNSNTLVKYDGSINSQEKTQKFI
jgi:mannosyltransferase OCH1-like enzyme